MLNTGTFLAFYAAVLAIQLSPGPDMVLVIGREIGQGPPDRHSEGGWYDPPYLAASRSRCWFSAWRSILRPPAARLRYCDDGSAQSI